MTNARHITMTSIAQQPSNAQKYVARLAAAHSISLQAATEHLAQLMDKARSAGDIELYVDLQSQMASALSR